MRQWSRNHTNGTNVAGRVVPGVFERTHHGDYFTRISSSLGPAGVAASLLCALRRDTPRCGTGPALLVLPAPRASVRLCPRCWEPPWPESVQCTARRGL